MHTQGRIFCVCIIAISLILILLVKKQYEYESMKISIDNIIPIIEYDRVIEQNEFIESKPQVNYVNELIEQYKISRDPSILITIGDFYRKGMYSIMSSDNSKAIKYYERAAMSDNKHVAEIARGKYAEATIDTIPKIDDIGDELNELETDTLFLFNDNDGYQNQQMVNIRELPIDNVEFVNRMEIVDAPNQIFLNDLQNVHDHYMNKITQANINKLKAFDNALDPSIKNTLTDDLYKDSILSINDKAIIISVLNAFDNNNKQFDCTEVECLQLVYAYIRMRDDMDDLLHNLFLQLLDCMEHHIIVCTTGKISRIISVVSYLDDFEDAKNIYYIKLELEQLASRVREDILASLTPDQVNAYNNNLDCEDIIMSMQQTYRDHVKNEYCDKLGVNYSIIRPHVEANLAVF